VPTAKEAREHTEWLKPTLPTPLETAAAAQRSNYGNNRRAVLKLVISKLNTYTPSPGNRTKCWGGRHPRMQLYLIDKVHGPAVIRLERRRVLPQQVSVNLRLIQRGVPEIVDRSSEVFEDRQA